MTTNLSHSGRLRTVGLWWLALTALGGDFHAAYLIVPFLCWVPNLVVTEMILRK